MPSTYGADAPRLDPPLGGGPPFHMNEGKPSRSRVAQAALASETEERVGEARKRPGQYTLASCIIDLLEILSDDGDPRDRVAQLAEQWFDDLDQMRSRGR